MKRIAFLFVSAVGVGALIYFQGRDTEICDAPQPLTLPYISNDTPGYMLDLPNDLGRYRYIEATSSSFFGHGRWFDWSAEGVESYCAEYETMDGLNCAFFHNGTPRYGNITSSQEYVMETDRHYVSLRATIVQADGAYIEIFVSGDTQAQADCNLTGALHALGAPDS